MSESIHEAPLVDPLQLGRWFAERRHIWQMELLDEKQLAEFSDRRGLFFPDADIRRLWRLGLLRADLVVSSHKLQRPGFHALKQDEQGQYLYADLRQARHHPQGWRKALANLKSPEPDVHPLFHPFRYYLLTRFETWPSVRRSPMAYFYSRKSQKVFQKWEVARFEHISASEQFVQDVALCDEVVSLVIATEPCFYGQIFGHLIVRSHRGRTDSLFTQDSEKNHEILRQHIAQHWEDVVGYFRNAGIERLEKERRELCFAADMLEPNKRVHTLLRLADGEVRLQFEGTLSGALYVLTMAEMLRRATERTFNVWLPEENELGFRGFIQDGKKKFYGSHRLLDGNRAVADEFVRHMRLDFGLRLSWYVEGPTEEGALQWCFKELGTTHIDVVDLHGRFIQKKVGTFRERLQADLAAQVFSFISLDGDRSDFMKPVEIAVDDDLICGRFFVHIPDFEFANFVLDELEEVIWQIAGASLEERPHLHEAIKGIQDARTLFERVQALPSFVQVSKGILWGQRLCEYALAHPYFPPFAQNRGGQLRPLVEAIQAAIRLENANYRWIRQHYHVDRKTGDSVERTGI